MFFRAAPIDVSPIVREHLLDRFETTVLTSATLAVDGSFDYLRSRLGIRRAVEVRLPSEFDYTTQAVLYLPEAHAVAERRRLRRRRRARVRRDCSRGPKAARSCCSRATRCCAPWSRSLATQLDYPMLVQGRAPRSALLAEFRQTPHAVLLATSSFWQGVDVVGEALSCVIIDKLPFASPGDPITAARMEAINDAGRRPVRRIPGAAGDPDAAAGPGPPDPSSERIAACSPSSIRACGRWATDGGSWRRCRRRRSRRPRRGQPFLRTLTS